MVNLCGSLVRLEVKFSRTSSGNKCGKVMENAGYKRLKIWRKDFVRIELLSDQQEFLTMAKKCSICRQGLIKRVQCPTSELQNKAIRVFNKNYSCNADGIVRINGPFECGHRYHLVCWLQYMRKLTAVSLFCGNEEGDILCPVKRCGGKFRSGKEVDVVPRSHYIPEILRSKCRGSIRQVRGELCEERELEQFYIINFFGRKSFERSEQRDDLDVCTSRNSGERC